MWNYTDYNQKFSDRIKWKVFYITYIFMPYYVHLFMLGKEID